MSFRDVEDLLYKRGVIVSYGTIRSWVGKLGHQYAKVIRRDRPAPSDKWHLDEVVITIRGKKYWLWRAVDSKGDVPHQRNGCVSRAETSCQKSSKEPNSTTVSKRPTTPKTAPPDEARHPNSSIARRLT
jgi:hypothetical protein